MWMENVQLVRICEPPDLELYWNSWNPWVAQILLNNSNLDVFVVSDSKMCYKAVELKYRNGGGNHAATIGLWALMLFMHGIHVMYLLHKWCNCTISPPDPWLLHLPVELTTGWKYLREKNCTAVNSHRFFCCHCCCCCYYSLIPSVMILTQQLC